MGGLLIHFLQYKVLHCLHCRSELLQVELDVALRDVARAMVQQALGGVIAQAIANLLTIEAKVRRRSCGENGTPLFATMLTT